MRTSKRSIKNRGLIALLAAASLVLGTAGPAAADSGTGAFTGYEEAPPSTLYDPLMTGLCAFFDADPANPWRETLTLAGTWSGEVGTGTAIYTSDHDWDGSPLGTFAPGQGCDLNTLGHPVAGTMTVTFSPVTGGTISCTGTANKSRIGSEVTITFSGTCTEPDGTGFDATATFTGVMVPCPIVGCQVPAASSSLEDGVYQQQDNDSDAP